MGLRGDPDAGIFAVFDGHCGTEVSRFAARYLVGQCGRIQGIIKSALMHTHTHTRSFIDHSPDVYAHVLAIQLVCMRLQPGQLERTHGWSEGDVGRGLHDTFLRIDQACTVQLNGPRFLLIGRSHRLGLKFSLGFQSIVLIELGLRSVLSQMGCLFCLSINFLHSPASRDLRPTWLVVVLHRAVQSVDPCATTSACTSCRWASPGVVTCRCAQLRAAASESQSP